MHTHDVFRDCQTQPRSLDAFDGRVLDAIELLENVAVVLRRDADPGVTDAHAHDALVGLQRDADRALRRRVLDRVAQQVDPDLVQPMPIAHDERHLGGQAQGQVDRARVGIGLHVLNGLPQRVVQLDRGALELRGAGLDR